MIRRCSQFNCSSCSRRDSRDRRHREGEALRWCDRNRLTILAQKLELFVTNLKWEKYFIKLFSAHRDKVRDEIDAKHTNWVRLTFFINRDKLTFSDARTKNRKTIFPSHNSESPRVSKWNVRRAMNRWVFAFRVWKTLKRFFRKKRSARKDYSFKRF